jgi:hypothetical protein
MIQLPFITLPLAQSPYFSRISDNYDKDKGVKNYFLIAFKPGFPLQASELNEMQEQFYVQQTLTNHCIGAWTDRSPFWEGATPWLPGYITISGTGTTRTVTVSSGWFYLNKPGGTATKGIGLWVWNTSSYSESINFSTAIGDEINLYLESPSIITVNEDSTLSDNSGGGSTIKSFGSDRMKVNINGYTELAGGLNEIYTIGTIARSGTTPRFTYSINSPNGVTLASFTV